MNSRQLGILGEKIAARYLKRKGYQILDKNYSDKFISGPKRGEIDIIAKKKDVISFIEVKTLRLILGDRKGTEEGQFLIFRQGLQFLPEEKVDFKKQKKIIKMAESWLIKNKITLDSKWQIDVISIRIDLENKKAKIRHFLNVACGSRH